MSWSVVLVLVMAGMSRGGPIVANDFDGTTSWNFVSDVSFFQNGWGSDGYFDEIALGSATPLDSSSFSGDILGVNDLDDEDDHGTSGTATLLFDVVSVTSYSNVKILFDYDFDVTNDDFEDADDVVVEAIFDNVDQGGTDILPDGATSLEGTHTIAVPDDVEQVALRLALRQNAGDEYLGFDNFQVVPEPGSIALLGVCAALWLGRGRSRQRSPQARA
jgi:hypothetical protein